MELCFTPANASRANSIEAHFGALRQFTLANSHHPNHTVQTRSLQAYLRWRNTPTPATPKSSQPSDENAPEYTARRACAGEDAP